MTDESKIVDVGDRVSIAGKQYILSALQLRQLIVVQQEAFRAYKRDYLQTFADTLSLLYPDHSVRQSMLAQKVDEVSRWTIKSLPRIPAYSLAAVELNDGLKQWCHANYPLDQSQYDDRYYKGLLTTALDAGTITCEHFTELANVAPQRGLIPYDMWWITAAYAGMVTFVTASLQRNHPEITEQTVNLWPIPDVIYCARRIEQLTEPSAGNSEG